ncbi:hypothetical protein FisN_2Lh364 [Fistulifera solaris]|uniref:Uncharacterized protein n=1 Tax=Fistulifera solaris TaxID=1519565 RepID=A0A1Z5JPY3_FISSO|nr:hypothetical protein FisN_2Lh364 [Fistulifera solaris]|eukprot:GAX15902.1 hypothetical protein FisN_2Lh364 [Fistulifera solaris]
MRNQDSVPRRPHRANSPERNLMGAAILPKTGGPTSRNTSENVSDLSNSHGSLSSTSSFFSSTDGSGPTSAGSSFSSLSSPLRKRFSTSSRLSLFSSQPPGKKKIHRKCAKKKPQQLNRWDSSEECKPKGLPQKPQRADAAQGDETASRVRDVGAPPRERMYSDESAISRWSSHVNPSSYDVNVCPRRSGSPRKPSRPPLIATPDLQSLPKVSTSLKNETNYEREIEFHPNLIKKFRKVDSKVEFAETINNGVQTEHRAVLFRQPKAHNLLLSESSHSHPPALIPRLPPWNPHSNADPIHKLKCPFAWAESKRSIATASTRESSASSAACPDYSIPWFAARQQQSKFGP